MTMSVKIMWKRKEHMRSHILEYVPNETKGSWQTIEGFLLGFFLVCRFFLLWMHWGRNIGFDSVGHLALTNAISWRQPILDMHTYFYGYHPPLGFLFAHTLTMIGLPTVLAVQLISFAAALTSFFAVRAVLGYTEQLWSPRGIAFLYIAHALPIQIFLTVSSNLDSLILCEASLILLCSVHLFWEKQEQSKRMETF